MKINFLKPKKLSLVLGVLIILAAVFSVGWWIGHPQGSQQRTEGKPNESTMWTCSMHPQIMQPDPGNCPLCGMDLIPASGKSNDSDKSIVIGPNRAESMGIRITPVNRELATRIVSLVGQVVPDERYTNTITSRVNGRIERLFVDYTGISVKKGDHLVDVYSPDLLVAQKELIEAKKSLDLRTDSKVLKNNRLRLYLAAMEKLRLLELSDEQIGHIESSARPNDQLTIFAPEAGVVTKKHVKKGDYIKTGTALYTVSDLTSVWVTMDAYEQDLPWLHYGQKMTFTTPAAPGKVFTGSIAFIDPVLNTKTRTSRVRVNVKNDGMILKPGMFARAKVQAKINANGEVVLLGLKDKWISPMHPEILKDKPGECDICGMPLVQTKSLGIATTADSTSLPLMVPHSAVLQTGNKAIVYKRNVLDDELEFEAVEVTLGHRVDHSYIIKTGLNEGDFVVSQGAFKIDSELQINAKKSMLSMPASYVGPPVPSRPLDAKVLINLKSTISIYLQITNDLAHDRPEKAIAQSATLAKLLASSSNSALEQLADKVQNTKTAKDVKAWIDPVTTQLAASVKDQAADQLDPLYLLYCPMAIDGEGGHWLAPSHKVENPYFGSEMFGCGSVKSQLTVKAHQMPKVKDKQMKPMSKSSGDHNH